MSALRLPAKKTPGVCRHCGCTERKPCRWGRYWVCSWLLPDVCSNRECVQKEIDRVHAEVAAGIARMEGAA